MGCGAWAAWELETRDLAPVPLRQLPRPAPRPSAADGGKEIAKHLAALSRTLKVNKGSPAWRR